MGVRRRSGDERDDGSATEEFVVQGSICCGTAHTASPDQHVQRKIRQRLPLPLSCPLVHLMVCRFHDHVNSSSCCHWWAANVSSLYHLRLVAAQVRDLLPVMLLCRRSGKRGKDVSSMAGKSIMRVPPLTRAGYYLLPTCTHVMGKFPSLPISMLQRISLW